jgi:F-type H+-transporting ATPase subunit a
MISLLAMSGGPSVSVMAEHVFDIGPIHVSNSMVLGTIGWVVTFWLLIRTARRISVRRYDRLSLAVLWAYEYLFNTAQEVLGSRELALKITPIAITMFFFILVNNWLEILPLLGTVTWHNTPLFRGLAADLNFTFALAVVTFATAHIWAIRKLGFFGNLKRYFRNPFKDVLGAFEGFLELIAEFSRFIALSMRLFGNIFGGEVLIAVMAFITSFFSVVALPPFMLFELFIGLIQAYIFFMLTVVFVSLGISHNEAHSSPGVEERADQAASLAAGEPA